MRYRQIGKDPPPPKIPLSSFSFYPLLVTANLIHLIMIDIIIQLAISAYIGSHVLEEEVEYEEYEPDDACQ